MKYKGVFGLCLALHVGAGIFIITQPGCQTTQKERSSNSVQSQPAPVQPDQAEVAPLPVQSGAEFVDDAFNSGAPAGATPVMVRGSQSAASREPVRATPRRPEPEAPQQTLGVLSGAAAPSKVPGSTPSANPEGDFAIVEENLQSFPHTVERGESLWGISKKYGVGVADIRTASGLRSDTLQVGQVLTIPSASGSRMVQAPPSEMVNQAVAVQGEGREYIVARGDTLSGIASKTGVPVAQIRSANNLRSDLIRVGDVLILPDSARLEGAGASRGSGTAPAPAVAPGVSGRSERIPQGGVFHEVQSGENPTVIARRYGITVQQLLNWNNNFDPRLLRVGQRLRVGEIDTQSGETVEVTPAPRQRTPAPATTRTDDDLDALLRELETAPVVVPVPVD